MISTPTEYARNVAAEQIIIFLKKLLIKKQNDIPSYIHTISLQEFRQRAEWMEAYIQNKYTQLINALPEDKREDGRAHWEIWTELYRHLEAAILELQRKLVLTEEEIDVILSSAREPLHDKYIYMQTWEFQCPIDVCDFISFLGTQEMLKTRKEPNQYWTDYTDIPQIKLKKPKEYIFDGIDVSALFDNPWDTSDKDWKISYVDRYFYIYRINEDRKWETYCRIDMQMWDRGDEITMH